MKNIILFGGPGSGKGTQAERLIKQYKLIHVATGIILREEMKQKTELGIIAKNFIDQGQLVPDSVIINIVKSIIQNEKNVNGFLYDGFPRTQKQAVELDNIFKMVNMQLDKVFFLIVDEELLVKRLLLRSFSSGRTDDANEQIIRARIKEYKLKTEPVKQFYDTQHLLTRIDGNQSVDDVYRSIVNNL